VTKVFERAPLLIQRSAVCPEYYTQWFSSDEIRRMLREDTLKCVRSALWNPFHRSCVNSGQRFNRGRIGQPLLNADGKPPGGLA